MQKKKIACMITDKIFTSTNQLRCNLCLPTPAVLQCEDSECLVFQHCIRGAICCADGPWIPLPIKCHVLNLFFIQFGKQEPLPKMLNIIAGDVKARWFNTFHTSYSYRKKDIPNKNKIPSYLVVLPHNVCMVANISNAWIDK